MAKAAEPKPARDVSVLLREVAGVVLFGVAAFLLLAFTSFRERGPEAQLGRFANVCGDAGYALARTALFWFGYAAYLGVVILFTWSLALIARRRLTIGPFRLVWLGVFLFCAAALISHLVTAPQWTIPDAGGLVGYRIAHWFEIDLAFGSWGTKLVLLVLALITFQLATDFVMYEAVLGLLKVLEERRQRAAELLAASGPLFSSLLSDRGGSDAAPAPRPARSAADRKRQKAAAEPGQDDVEIGVRDDEVTAPDADPAEAEPPKKARARKEAAPAGAEAAAPPAATPAKSKPANSAKAAPAEAGPPMLDDDPDSALAADGEDGDLPETKKKVQAKIHFEPPKLKQPRNAAFDEEHVAFVAPARSERIEYKFPSIDLLEHPKPVPAKEFQKMIETNIEVLESALKSYKVEAEVEEIQKGPVITMFELNVAPGTRVDRIRALEDDLAIRMKAQSVRIVAPIPGKSTIGIEVPNSIRETVRLRELVESPDYNSSNFAIPVFLGKDAAGRVLIEDLAKMPHMLVAGATGAGKSVCLNTIILSVLYTRTPDQVKMIMIDPKMVELSSFENIPHLMCPVVRDMSRAAQILEWACEKMDHRYEVLAEVGARNIFAYNKISEAEKREKLGVADDDEMFEPRMPFIVIVVDELADLIMTAAKDVENHITRLAQKSRAVGIHIILATQRPSTNVITGLIKANMPTRISFQVASKIDSRVVLDQNGAEKLLGYGDMLYLPPRTSTLVRAQGAFVSDEEIKGVVDSVKTNAPQFARELMQKNARSEVDPREVDDLYDEAARFVCDTKRGSASLLQRKFSIGYTRASRLIDLMAADGILGEFKNAQAREVLLSIEEYEERSSASTSS